jgi:hypothetical protein
MVAVRVSEGMCARVRVRARIHSPRDLSRRPGGGGGGRTQLQRRQAKWAVRSDALWGSEAGADAERLRQQERRAAEAAAREEGWRPVFAAFDQDDDDAIRYSGHGDWHGWRRRCSDWKVLPLSRRCLPRN